MLHLGKHTHLLRGVALLAPGFAKHLLDGDQRAVCFAPGAPYNALAPLPAQAHWVVRLEITWELTGSVRVQAVPELRLQVIVARAHPHAQLAGGWMPDGLSVRRSPPARLLSPNEGG